MKLYRIIVNSSCLEYPDRTRAFNAVDKFLDQGVPFSLERRDGQYKWTIIWNYVPANDCTYYTEKSIIDGLWRVYCLGVNGPIAVFQDKPTEKDLADIKSKFI